MPRIPKTEEIKVRVSAEMKQRIVGLMEARDVSESQLVREALIEYLTLGAGSKFEPLSKKKGTIGRQGPTPTVPHPGESG